MSADDCSLLPPPNGSSMAMQVNARTHSEPFIAFIAKQDRLWQLKVVRGIRCGNRNLSRIVYGDYNASYRERLLPGYDIA